VEHEAAAAQQLIDIRKQGLVLVKWNELDFGLDDEALIESLAGMRQNLRLASLGI